MRARNRTPEQTQPAGSDESGFCSGLRAESAASPLPPRPDAASHCAGSMQSARFPRMSARQPKGVGWVWPGAAPLRHASLRSFVMRPVWTHSATKMLPAASQQASCEWRNFPAYQLAHFSSRSSNVTRALRSGTSFAWSRGARLAGSAAAGRMRRAERSRGGARRGSGGWPGLEWKA